MSDTDDIHQNPPPTPESQNAVPASEAPAETPTASALLTWSRSALKWLTTNAVLISVFTAALSFVTAWDAHKEATHSEENTSAQIQVKAEKIDNSADKWLFVISDEGSGPAEFVRVFCMLKTQTRDWRPITTTALHELLLDDKPLTVRVFRRLTSHGDPIVVNPDENWCGHESAPTLAAEKIYVIVEYSTPWHDRYYDDWLLAIYNGEWFQEDAAPPAAMYRKAVIDWFENLPPAFGEYRRHWYDFW